MKTRFEIFWEHFVPLCVEIALFMWFLISRVIVFLLSLTGMFLVSWLFSPAYRPQLPLSDWHSHYAWHPVYYDNHWQWRIWVRRRRCVFRFDGSAFSDPSKYFIYYWEYADTHDAKAYNPKHF